MCTVAVMRVDGGVIIAGNRDESLTREPARPPREFVIEGVRVVAPIDGRAGGTWTLVTERGLAMSLLNNYQAPQVPTDSDSISRGLLVRSLAAASTIDDVLARIRTGSVPLERVRPFMLIVASAAGKAWIVRWDRSYLTCSDLHLPAIIVSNGGDIELARRHRTETFSIHRASWGEQEPTNSQLERFFASHRPERGHFSVCMHFEPWARTRSYTAIRLLPGCAEIEHLTGSPCQPEERVQLSLLWGEQA